MHPLNKVSYRNLQTFCVANAALAGYPDELKAVAAAATALLFPTNGGDK